MLAGLAVVGGSSSEFFLLQYQRYMLNLFHRQLFCLMDEWFGMTIEEIRVYEGDWGKQLQAFLASVPDDHYISMVDFHI